MTLPDDNDLYYSNNGRGPLVARIVKRLENGQVVMERKGEGQVMWHRFTIKADFLDNSPYCGWKKRKPQRMHLPRVG